jgi:hypothetical protein
MVGCKPYWLWWRPRRPYASSALELLLCKPAAKDINTRCVPMFGSLSSLSKKEAERALRSYFSLCSEFQGVANDLGAVLRCTMCPSRDLGTIVRCLVSVLSMIIPWELTSESV